MKINSMQRMLGTLMAAAIVGSSAIIVPVVSAQNAPGHYSDDAIVRDLKAGKLTVREAQMLRARRDRAAAPVPPPPPRAMPPARPLHVAKKPPHPHHPAHPARSHKPAKAPIRHLTAPHPKKSPRLHRKPPHAAAHRVEHQRPEPRTAAHGKPHRPAAEHAAAAPVRHQAVKYIR
jgi:hypothetical protein